MTESATNLNQLRCISTEELKDKLLQLTQGRDTEPLNKKVWFYKKELEPIFEELNRRNPFPAAEDQARIIPGVWIPIWSTIPFQDSLPGRLREQSYQIFHNDGYYANIARYAPGGQHSFLQKFAGFLLAYDFMILQKFAVQNGQWAIQNVGIEQAFRLRGIPLDTHRAENWFSAAVQSRLQPASEKSESSKVPQLSRLSPNSVKKIFLATPYFEHLYIDSHFRLVKTQREAKQRPSHTIALRVR